MKRSRVDERAFCKMFPDCSHLAVLWNERDGVHFELPTDLWSLPHDQASGFLRRVAEGRPTEEDRQIIEDYEILARSLHEQQKNSDGGVSV